MIETKWEKIYQHLNLEQLKNLMTSTSLKEPLRIQLF